jgi:hypothetical protein
MFISTSIEQIEFSVFSVNAPDLSVWPDIELANRHGLSVETMPYRHPTRLHRDKSNSHARDSWTRFACANSMPQPSLKHNPIKENRPPARRNTAQGRIHGSPRCGKRNAPGTWSRAWGKAQ